MTGPDAEAVVESSGAELTVGTAPGCDLRLSDPAVSRHHCALVSGPRGVELRDLDSTNGTSLGGYQIFSALLSQGAMISIGQTLLAFEETGEHVTQTLSTESSFGEVLGESDAMRRLFEIAQRVAPTDATVLLEGETGTGKELFAEAIHANSPRADGPFVVVDCGNLPATLIEAELFGHEKGAFTGAQTDRVGMFDAASGGTVFLDEIGEMPLELQPKLLRVLEKREVRRIGSNVGTPIDIRVIAATNCDLRREVNAGSFRADLWYRLNTFRLSIPPLRERRDDIPLLVSHFYSQLVEGSAAPTELVAAMQVGSWRGNVRELRSAVERAVITDNPYPDNGASVWAEPPTAADFDESQSFRAAKLRATERWDRVYLQELLRRHDGVILRAAQAARMDRGHLRRLLRRYGMRTPKTQGK